MRYLMAAIGVTLAATVGMQAFADSAAARDARAARQVRACMNARMAGDKVISYRSAMKDCKEQLGMNAAQRSPLRAGT